MTGYIVNNNSDRMRQRHARRNWSRHKINVQLTEQRKSNGFPLLTYPETSRVAREPYGLVLVVLRFYQFNVNVTLPSIRVPHCCCSAICQMRLFSRIFIVTGWLLKTFLLIRKPQFLPPTSTQIHGIYMYEDELIQLSFNKNNSARGE